MTITTEGPAAALAEQMNLVLLGARRSDAATALTNHLMAVIAQSCVNAEVACREIDRLAEQMKAALTEHWDHFSKGALKDTKVGHA